MTDWSLLKNFLTNNDEQLFDGKITLPNNSRFGDDEHTSEKKRSDNEDHKAKRDDKVDLDKRGNQARNAARWTKDPTSPITI